MPSVSPVTPRVSQGAADGSEGAANGSQWSPGTSLSIEPATGWRCVPCRLTLYLTVGHPSESPRSNKEGKGPSRSKDLGPSKKAGPGRAKASPSTEDRPGAPKPDPFHSSSCQRTASSRSSWLNGSKQGKGTSALATCQCKICGFNQPDSPKGSRDALKALLAGKCPFCPAKRAFY